MKKYYIIILMFLLLSCNGQDQKENNSNKKNVSTKKIKMQNIDIHLWQKKAEEFMNNKNGEGEQISLENPYYYFKEEKDNKIIEFSGDDREGYSLKELVPEPNIYYSVNFYRNNGKLQYSFKTLKYNPNIVIGEYTEYNENGLVINTKNYDAGFKTSPEKIIEIIKSSGGNPDNELTIIDREKKENSNIWHVEFLNTKNKKVQILTIDDRTLQALIIEERDSDFLED